ncbi:MAG: redoxin domain-containing protein [Methylococcaceae bacterium]|nr:redoxin domain-containing protein [Methylococcaceae bacterium]
MKARIGQKAPLFSVSEWLQGQSTNFDKLLGNVILVEVFQVNCPGCFLYALPQAIDLHRQYSNQGLVVLGIATAFEDFDKNTLENLQKLVNQGEVIGETLYSLSQHGILKSGRLPYNIPFSLAMDKLVKRDSAVSETEVLTFIREHLPDFDRQPNGFRKKVIGQVQDYLQKLDYHAHTFELFNLKGTPSYILVDKQGILRDCGFGNHPEMENQIKTLLQEL